MSLDIQEKHRAIISEILAKPERKGLAVYAFGSRAKGVAGKYSDLDLAVDNAGHPLPSRAMLRLMIDFENSLLPYKVDVVDLNNISAEFKSVILPDLLNLG